MLFVYGSRLSDVATVFDFFCKVVGWCGDAHSGHLQIHVIKTGAQNLVKIADGASEKLLLHRLPHIAHGILDVREKLDVPA